MGFRVTTAVATEVVSLTEAKAHLRVDDSNSDTYISALIAAAREEAEHLTERSIGDQTITLTLDALASEILLVRPPVTSVTSVKYYDTNGAQQTISGANYRVDHSAWPPRLQFDWRYTLPDTDKRADAVEVVYAAGWTSSTCPKAVKQYILVRLSTMFENRVADDVKPPMPAPWVERLLDPVRIPGV